MCLVEVEKMPKLMTACTLPVAEGMVVRTDTPQVAAARKYMLEFLLTNHPLDCPVCDKGGECELQDMTFRYGVGESRFTEEKVHTPEKQFSPVVFFDAPRCILCYRCVRVCDEGMGVNALGVINRGRGFGNRAQQGRPPGVRRVRRLHRHLSGGRAHQRRLPLQDAPLGNDPRGHHLHALRRWLQDHAGHAQRPIIRGNNRDRSGINGEFLCIKGRYAFDFYDHPERLQAPLARVNGKLEEVSWAQALAAGGAEIQRNARARRQLRRHRLQPHHQRRELLPAEFRAPGAAHQSHRPPPHRRRGDAARRAGGTAASWPPWPTSTSARRS